MKKRPFILIIMDGWALSPTKIGNAVALGNTPNFDKLWSSYPHTILEAFGESVGLPDGTMGGSEVGHLNLGAGRIVQQDLTYINFLIKNGDFFTNPSLLDAINNAKKESYKTSCYGTSV